MLPEKFLQRMKSVLDDEYEDFLESLSGERYRALRLNTLKADVKELEAKVPFHLTPVPWTENGFYYEEEDKPGRHPLHEAGVYYIQEPSAMAPVPQLFADRDGHTPKPCVQDTETGGLLSAKGERVLDLCAAPGGKTTQIAEYMQGNGLLVTNEIHPARAKILSENVERMGIANAIVLNETPESLARRFVGFFDRILVDAPCSGEGMFRKNDTAGEEWSEENVTLCANRQDEILACAAVMLRPGGRMVYSTCTFAEEEDEGAIRRFTDAHPDFTPVLQKKLMPHKVKGEGHFLAVLNRGGESKADAANLSAAGLEKSRTVKDYREFAEFVQDTLNMSVESLTGGKTLISFGEQLYLSPADTPSLKGLKVLRPGLHLGTIKKNRFEPSHALALYLRKEQVKRMVDLPMDGNAVKKYLEGQTLTIGEDCDEAAKGWCLVCVDGFSLGWGKVAGGILKNHYPKGLRKG